MEGNDQESIQLPNIFHSKTPKGKKDAHKVTVPQRLDIGTCKTNLHFCIAMRNLLHFGETHASFMLLI